MVYIYENVFHPLLILVSLISRLSPAYLPIYFDLRSFPIC